MALSTPPIVVVVPTRDRPELLRNRALRSVTAQDRPPDLVLVVDDSTPEQRALVQEVVGEAGRRAPCDVEYLRNTHAPGLAGALNTALDRLALRHPDAVVATLDDDDEWEPAYLCTVAAEFATGADVVTTGLIRHEGNGVVRETFPPTNLSAAHFLVGNPGVQGSNTVARLAVLLEAGGFDEDLPSCTDRDLMIRLLDLPSVELRVVTRALVRHHAEPGRLRLSTPGSAAKTAGARRLRKKWRHRMTADQLATDTARALRLFGVDPGAPEQGDAPSPVATAQLPDAIPDSARPTGCLSLDVGVATVAGGPLAAGFVREIATLAADPRARRVRLVIARAPGADPLLNAAIAEAHAAGVAVVEVPLAPGAEGRPASLAANRRVVRDAVLDLPDAVADVVWLADDDLRLDVDVLDPETGRTRHLRTDLIGDLLLLRAEGVDVVLGWYSGAPPVPEAASVRGALLDLTRELERLCALAPDAPAPDGAGEAAAARLARPESYYDLAESDRPHRETALPILPPRAGATVTEAVRALADGAVGLLHGAPQWRSLALPPRRSARALRESCVPSDACGGATFVFTPGLLRVPLAAPVLGGREVRRGDMAWAIRCRALGARVVSADLRLRHARGPGAGGSLDIAKMADDILGHGACAALREVLGSPAVSDGAYRLFRGAVRRRLTAFVVSAARVRGLARTLERLVTRDPRLGERLPGLLADPSLADAFDRLAGVARDLQRAFAAAHIEALVARVDAACVRREFEVWLDAAVPAAGTTA